MPFHLAVRLVSHLPAVFHRDRSTVVHAITDRTALYEAASAALSLCGVSAVAGDVRWKEANSPVTCTLCLSALARKQRIPGTFAQPTRELSQP